MMDMGAPGYLVASAVRAVVAQRLVRKVCTDCKVEDELDEPRKQWLSVRFPNQVAVPFMKGRGCQNCNLTGYRGRIGVFEMLELEQDMMDASERMTRLALLKRQGGLKTTNRCWLLRWSWLCKVS